MSFVQALENMPHSGSMLLLEQIVSADERAITCLAKPHVEDSYPLRIDGVLYAVALSEIGAQTAAAHASLFQMKGKHKGMLIALKNVVSLHCVVPDEPMAMLITARQLHSDSYGAIYEFDINGPEQSIVSGQAVLKMGGEAL